MKTCHLEPMLNCIHLEGVCPFRTCEHACEDYRHYLRDNPKVIKPIELARDYERTLSPNKSEGVIRTNVLVDNNAGTQQVQTGSDTYHRPDDDMGGTDGSAGRER